MIRVVVQLALAREMPRPLLGDGGVSLFGVWLRERIASIAIDWPAVAFHRVGLGAGGIELVLLPRSAAPPEVAGLAVARAVRGEIQSAALACSGLRSGQVWEGSAVVTVERETRDERRETGNEGGEPTSLDYARDEGC